MLSLSVDARVALAPEATYRQLLAGNAEPGWRVIARPALVLLVIGAILPIMAVRQVTAGLVLTTALAWSMVVAMQVAIGAVIIMSAPARPVGFARALDLWFAGHVPYSAWLLLLPFLTLSPAIPPHDVMGISFLLPLAWTTVIAGAFCRVVLGMSPRRARRSAAIHAVCVAVLIAALGLWAAGGAGAAWSYIVRRLASPWS
jgi:hypothetical protein